MNITTTPKMAFCAAEVAVYYRNTQHPELREKVTTASQAYYFLKPYYGDSIEHRESFYALYLNRASDVIGVYRVSEGGIAATMVDVRLILSTALQLCATAIIVAHNHPSGNMTPSRDDIAITAKLNAAAKIMDISVLDHIILSEWDYYSFADHGMMSISEI